MFYVYALVDPRNGKPFYVGKGKGNRSASHEKEARRGIVSSKCDTIRAIWDAGLEVERRVLRKFSDEDKAYAYERRLIAKIGLANLTNLAVGGRCAWPYRKDESRELDKAYAKAYVKLLTIKEKGQIPCFRWAGRMFELRKSLIEKIIDRGTDVVSRRGADWVIKAAAVC